jgi:hypothetical protein
MRLRLLGPLCAGLLLATTVRAQVTGGQHAFEFLRLPQSAHISALGGINVAYPGEDISLALQNPSLMRPSLHNQLSLAYNAYYAGISIANLGYGYHVKSLNTSFLLGVQYLNYGSFDAMDNIGNTIGNFRATDYSITLGASRSYLERWRYGASLKFAGSKYADKSASALMADVGITYVDTNALLVLGASAKNIGFMMQKYAGSDSEPLPFDLQLGISKRFKHLPLRLMVTAHHLYEWDVYYNNPADIQAGNVLGSVDSSELDKSHFADKLFRHLIFAAEITIANRVTLNIAYNHLHRGEMGLDEKKGAAGFSFGAGIDLNKVQIHYARSYYSVVGAYNEFSLSLNLNQMVGIGSKTEEWGWNSEYPRELGE